MRQRLLLSILFDLLQSRRATATALAEKYGVSTRTVYRCVDELSSFLPVHVRRGRLGGVYLSDSYRLPVDFLSKEEYEGVVTALHLAYAERPSESLLSARQKITATSKHLPPRAAAIEAGTLLVLSTKNDPLADTLQALQIAIKEKKNVRLYYADLPQELMIEPHALAFVNEQWYLCGFCHTRRGFYLFSLLKIRAVFRTSERFRPRKFNADELLTGIPGMR